MVAGFGVVARARLEENARREQMAPAGGAAGPTTAVRGLDFAVSFPQAEAVAAGARGYHARQLTRTRNRETLPTVYWLATKQEFAAGIYNITH